MVGDRENSNYSYILHLNFKRLFSFPVTLINLQNTKQHHKAVEKAFR